MRSRHAIALCSALLMWSGAAAAEVLISPPLVAEGERVLDCYLVNVSQQSRRVKIEVFNREGEVVKTVRTTLGPFEEDVARTDLRRGAVVLDEEGRWEGSVLEVRAADEVRVLALRDVGTRDGGATKGQGGEEAAARQRKGPNKHGARASTRAQNDHSDSRYSGIRRWG